MINWEVIEYELGVSISKQIPLEYDYSDQLGMRNQLIAEFMGWS